MTRTGAPLDAAKEYAVAGWASVNEGTDGPPIWDVVTDYVAAHRVVAPISDEHVKVTGI